MRDGYDAVSDWPLLNAMLNVAGGATWVSLHHGGGVGMGYSQHSGVVIVCDGSEAADARISRVLWNDPGTGVMRHRSEEHTSELQSLMRISYAVFCLKTKKDETDTSRTVLNS